MRYYPLMIIPAIFAIALTSPAHAASDMDKLSYSFGAKAGENFREQEIKINAKEFSKGFSDAIAGKKLDYSEQEMQEALIKFQGEFIAKLEAKDKKVGAENLSKNDKFFADNKNKPNVKTTASGMQYVVINEGKGTPPKKSDVVTVNYRGTLLDGTEFDSSYGRKEPSTFPIKDLIPAWQEALTMMPPGSKWKIFVPPNLAYGDKGAGQVIGPNAALVFEIELVKVNPSTKH